MHLHFERFVYMNRIQAALIAYTKLQLRGLDPKANDALIEHPCRRFIVVGTGRKGKIVDEIGALTRESRLLSRFPQFRGGEARDKV